MKLTIKLMSYKPPSMPQEVGRKEMDVDGSTMIGDLRNQVKSQISYEPTVFLTSMGKEMKSNQTLADWKIVEGATIYLLVEDKPAEATSIMGGKRNKKSNRQRKSKKNRNSRRKF